MFLWIATLVVIAACTVSLIRMFQKAGPRPKWLYHLQYTSIFAGAYLIIQVYNASIFLTVAAISLTLIHIYDRTYTQHKANGEVSLLTETSRDMWLFVLLFCLFRALIYDYSAVPSGSMEPTLYAGDLLAVDKMAYQSKVPPFNTPLFTWSEPKAGDVIVFLSPEQPNTHYIKRVIAGPNDRVVYKDKTYFINGKAAKQSEKQFDYSENSWLETAQESLGDVQHAIQINQLLYQRDEIDIIVPEDHYFVSGDNRDHSYDSRFFGPIHKDQIIGRASHIITQFSYPVPLRFNRSGRIL